MAADGLGFLGISLDAVANEGHGTGDHEIGAPGAAVRAFVIPAREDVEIAREVRQTISATA